jgi:hypothetical protein
VVHYVLSDNHDHHDTDKEDANGQPKSPGSGFFVREGEIASNLHVVEGSTRGYAKVVGQKTKFDIEG